MGITAYDERDYTFGQTMLNLRVNIGLTQAGLAHELGISRHAIGAWEAGSSYPKPQHLTALIALAIQQRVFTSGQETEEIRALWKAAHQKVLLDELWLTTLLSQQHPPYLRPASNPPTATVETDISTTSGEHMLPATSTNLNLRVDWGDALALSAFYGREDEQTLLYQWIMHEHCRVIGVLGMGGIGKSALAVNTMHQLALGTRTGASEQGQADRGRRDTDRGEPLSLRVPTSPFEVVIFRSLRDAPSCEALLDDCLHVLSPQSQRLPLSAILQQRINPLLSLFRTQRVLLVLDNLECLLEAEDTRGHFRPGFEGYGQLLRSMAETMHQSCLLFTSREKPTVLRSLEGKDSPVRSLRLTGLDVAACQQLLVEKGVASEASSQQERLVSAYEGNPLALKIVAETIIDLFGGEIGSFLDSGVVLFGSIHDLLENHFVRLSMLEQWVLCWLAIMREPVTLGELQALLVTPLPPPPTVLEALDSLHRRSLIERGQHPGSFTLQSVVLEYVTMHLITQSCREIQQRQLDRLILHGLSLAHSKEYVRQTQERLLVSPLLTELQSVYRSRAVIETLLLSLLDALRKQDDADQGYAPANLITLLRLLRGDLSGLDLSHLCIRSVYLQSVQMRDASLSGSLIHDCVWTSAVSAPSYVAISPDGKWWAAGSGYGEVCLWEEGGQALRQIWQAHTNVVWTLAFSPDGQTVATGSIDGTVRLWHVESGAQLWTGRHKCPYNLAFSPSGSLLASGGTDATVRLWDVHTGTALQTLTHAGQVHAVAFSPDGQWLASCSLDGEIHLWQREKKESSIWVEIHSMHTSYVTSLAFAPDGRTLASAHQVETIRLWEVGSWRLLQTLPDLQAKYLVWSSDGRTLACCGDDKTIWLWDVEEGRYRAVLHGHITNIQSLAFTPDRSRLLSNSVDGILRLWDVETAQCVRVIAGYWVSLIGLDWSPDGTHLVSGGNDRQVTIWDVSGETAPRVLRGHSWYVFGTRWSPDGRQVASCGWDKTIRLWDATTGTCVRKFEDPLVTYMCLAWSPDGSLLACGTSLGGMQVWDMSAGRLRWVGQPSHRIFFDVAWSLDGTQLAGSSDDGSVYLWESAGGRQIQQFSGHHGWIYNVKWSPDGRQLASCSAGEDGGELFVWDVETAECIQITASHPGPVYAVAWSRSHRACPGGEQLISGGSDGKLRWWDVRSHGGKLRGECVRTLEASQRAINALRVSPDGKRLASCGHGVAIKIWDMESTELLQTLQYERPYERLNIAGIRGLNKAQKDSLRSLGVIEAADP